MQFGVRSHSGRDLLGSKNISNEVTRGLNKTLLIFLKVDMLFDFLLLSYQREIIKMKHCTCKLESYSHYCSLGIFSPLAISIFSYNSFLLSLSLFVL